MSIAQQQKQPKKGGRYRIPPHVKRYWIETVGIIYDQTTPEREKNMDARDKYISDNVRSKKTLTLPQIISTMDYICQVNAGSNFFAKSEIDPRLLPKLYEAGFDGNEKAVKMLSFVQGAADFNLVSTQDDEEYDVRIFHSPVKTLEQWRELESREGAIILQDTDKVKLLMLVKPPKPSRPFERAKKELGDKFWQYSKILKIWFNMREECHYYIYVGE